MSLHFLRFYKKIVIFIVGISLSVVSYAKEVINITYKDVCYELNGNIAIAKSMSEGKSDVKTLRIPPFIKYEGKTFPVTKIEEYGFEKLQQLIILELPNSIIKIGDGAFRYCTSLEIAILPDDEVDAYFVRAQPFAGCNKLSIIATQNGKIPRYLYSIINHSSEVPFSSYYANKDLKFYYPGFVPSFTDFAKVSYYFSLKKWKKKKVYETEEEYKLRTNKSNRTKFSINSIDSIKNLYISLFKPKKLKYKIIDYDSYYNLFTVTTNSSFGKLFVPISKEDVDYFKNNLENFEITPYFGISKNHLKILSCRFASNDKIFESKVFNTKDTLDYEYLQKFLTSNYSEVRALYHRYKQYNFGTEDSLSNATVHEIKSKEISTPDETSESLKKLKYNGSVQNQENDKSLSNLNLQKSEVDINIPKTNKNRKETFALIIANENYRRLPEVPFALNDGSIVSSYFINTLGIPEKNILIARNASLNDIKYNIKRLQDICEAYNGDASVIVYYAGHGVPDEETHDAFLLPVDGYADDTSTGLSLAELVNTLSNLSTKQSTLFLDACFSGTGREGAILSATRGVVLKPKDTVIKGNLVIFSASQGIETAHPYTEQGHGMFTYYLLKKLKETKGNTTLGELADYIINQVKRTSAVEGNMQTPNVRTSLANWKSRKM